jgi:putative PIN family toxin of toxin-antitoxin system
MKMVLDTNVLVSGLLQSQGNPGRILAFALSEALVVCRDEQILAECAEVLARPRFKSNPHRDAEVLAKLQPDGLPIQANHEPLGLPNRNDEPFLVAARAAAVDYSVTGILADYPPKKRRGCAVVSPPEFTRNTRCSREAMRQRRLPRTKLRFYGSRRAR